MMLWHARQIHCTGVSLMQAARETGREGVIRWLDTELLLLNQG